MADSSSTALNRALDNIRKCKGPGDFREWAGKLIQAMSLYAREMLLILDGTACPNEQGEREVGRRLTATCSPSCSSRPRDPRSLP